MIPDYQTLMLPVLRLAAEGETRVADVAERIADDLGLTPEERDELLPSGRQRVLHNRIHWAKFYMNKAGLIASPARGRFVATDKGKALLATAPDRIDVALLMQEPEFREFYKNEGGAAERNGVITKPLDTVSPPTTPEEQIDAAHAALQAALRDELLQRILANSPVFFEQLIVDLLVAMGYGGSHKDAAAQLGRSGDGGVDGIVNEDRLGLDRIYIQAKRYAPGNPVGRPDVNGFVGSLVGLGATKRVSSGSGGADDSDLARATRLAFDMERTLGFGTEHPLLYRPHRDPGAILDRDPELAARVHAGLEAALDRAATILRRRRPTFHALAKALFDAQAMDETAVLQILADGDLPP